MPIKGILGGNGVKPLGYGLGGAAVEETDPEFNETVLLLHGDGTNGGQNNTFVDSSSYNQTITRTGTPTQGTFNPFLGEGQYSRYLQAYDNIGDTHGDITLGTDNFTVGMFVYPIGYDGSIRALADHVTLHSSSNDVFILAHSQFLAAYNGAIWAIEINYTTDIVANKWQWIQVDRTGSTFRVSIDGSYVDGGGDTSSASLGAFGVGQFGYRAGQKDFLGYINNFVLYKGGNRGTIEVPSTSLTASDSNVKILTYQSNTLVNNGNDASITISANASTQSKIVPFSPFAPTVSYDSSVHGGSGYFGGSGNLLQIAGGTSTDFTLDDEAEWCVEFWVYMINPKSSYARVMQINNGNGWAIRFDATSGKIGLGRSDAGSTDNIEDPTALPSHQWTHFAFTNKNQSGTYHLRLFRNGAQVATTSGWTQGWTNADSTTSAGNLRIAAYYNTNFPGIMYLGTTRLVQGAYIYDSAFTPPTAPLTSTGTGTKLLLNFTNAEIIDNTMRNNLETVDNAQIDTSVKKFGTGSIEFDGNGDYLTGINQPYLTIGTGSYTFECWVYITTGVQAYHGLLSIVGGIQFQLNDERMRLSSAGAPVMIADVADAISLNTWTHLAFVRDASASNALKFFKDGTLIKSGTDSTNWNHTGALQVGRIFNSSIYDIEGYLDDVRLTLEPRYSSNFTAPTKAFPDR